MPLKIRPLNNLRVSISTRKLLEIGETLLLARPIVSGATAMATEDLALSQLESNDCQRRTRVPESVLLFIQHLN